MSRISFLKTYAQPDRHFDPDHELLSAIKNVTHTNRYDSSELVADNTFKPHHVDAAMKNPNFKLTPMVLSHQEFLAHPDFHSRIMDDAEMIYHAVQSKSYMTDDDAKKMYSHPNLIASHSASMRLNPDISVSSARNPEIVQKVKALHSEKYPTDDSEEHAFAFKNNGSGSMRVIGGISTTFNNIDAISVHPDHDFEKVASQLIQHGYSDQPETTATVHKDDSRLKDFYHLHGFKQSGGESSDGYLTFRKQTSKSNI